MTSLITNKGDFSAQENSPPLSNLFYSGVYGDYFSVSEAGIVDFGSGAIELYVNDIIVYNGTYFEKYSATSSLNLDQLIAPGADSLLFYDISEGKFAWMTAGDNLELNGTEIRHTTPLAAGVSPSVTALTSGASTFISSITIDANGHIKSVTTNILDNQSLEVNTDSGVISIDLSSETLTVTGGTRLNTSGSTNTITINHDTITPTNPGGDYVNGITFDSTGHPSVVSYGTFDSTDYLTWPAANRVLLSNGTNDFLSSSTLYYQSSILYTPSLSTTGNILVGNDILKPNDSDVTYISGGNSTISGGMVLLYGGSHASSAGDIQLRSSATIIGTWDNSLSIWNWANREFQNVLSISTFSHGTSANWYEAYNNYVASAVFSGGTLQFTQRDGGTFNATGSIGTVTSVAMTVPTGLSISGSPITTSGTLAVSLTAGYSIPTTAKQSQWDTAYNNHIVSGVISGSTLTLTQNDAGTVVVSGTFGTVTSVGVSVPTGLSVSGTPVTTSGTIAISLTAGYSIPTTANQSLWTTGYNQSVNSLSLVGSILTVGRQVSSDLTVDLSGLFDEAGLTLDQVTTNGNTTSNSITVGAISGTTGTFTGNVNIGTGAEILFNQFANSVMSYPSNAASIKFGSASSARLAAQYVTTNRTDRAYGLRLLQQNGSGFSIGGYEIDFRTSSDTSITSGVLYRILNNSTELYKIDYAGTATFSGDISAQAISGTTGTFSDELTLSQGDFQTLYYGTASAPPYSAVSAEGVRLFYGLGSTRKIGMAAYNDGSLRSYIILEDYNAPGSSEIALGTGGTERVRINDSGNVGIGVSPSYKFHVSGDAYITTYLGVGVSPHASYRINTIGDIKTSSGFIRGLYDTEDYVWIDPSIRVIRFSANGSQRFVIFSSYVGNNTNVYSGVNSDDNWTISNNTYHSWKLNGIEEMRLTTTGAYVVDHLSIGQSSVNATYELYVNGEGYATTDFTIASDERLKRRIDDMPNAIDVIMNLSPYRYEKDGKIELGLGAQSTYRILPEVVSSENDVWGIKYRQLTALNMKGIQEIRKEQLSDRQRIENLESENIKLKQKLQEHGITV